MTAGADPHDPRSRRDLLATLAWLRAMGADAAVGDTAIDWSTRGKSQPGAGFAMPSIAAGAALRSTLPAARPAPQQPAPWRALQPNPASAHSLVGDSGAAPRQPLSPAGPPDVVSRPAATPAPRVAPATRPFPSTLPDAAQTAARAAAKSARSLDELEAVLANFDGCGLKATAKNLCFYRGPATARLMIVGEAPGREEDLEGKPFVGRAGQLLERMLIAAGIAPDDVHITNIVYWRPPGNRTPTPQEAQICWPFMERQIELVAPRIVLPLGAAAAKQFIDSPDGIMRLRGKWHDLTIGSHTCRALASLHPAYLLRTPIAKRPAWLDLLAVADALGVPPRAKP